MTPACAGQGVAAAPQRRTRPAGHRAVLLAALPAALLAAGCAAPGRPAEQTLWVQTPGCEQASCALENELGHWQVARTPGSVTLRSARGPLRVQCRAGAGALGQGELLAAADAPSGAGAVAGGVAGGAAVGAALGATALAFIPPLGILTVLGGAAAGAAGGQALEGSRQPLRYPASITIPMSCTVAPAAAAASPAVGMQVRGLTADEALAAGAAGLAPGLGVRVLAVAAGSAAAAAGLRSGDILLQADGQGLADAADLAQHLQQVKPGQPVALRAWRDGRLLDLALAAAPRQPPAGSPAGPGPAP